MTTSRAPNASKLISLALLLMILSAGAWLRFEAFAESQVPTYPHGDAARYFLYAYNLKNFGVFGNTDMTLLPADSDRETVRAAIKPDALVTPGYPAFLSLFMGGEYVKKQMDSARFVQVLLSALTVLLAYAAFASIGPYYALGVAALTALSPHLVNMNLFLLTEALFCFLLTAFVWSLSYVRNSSGSILYLAIGLLFSMAVLTRPWLQGYLFVLIAYLMLSRLRVPVGKALLVLVGAAVIAAPWMLRNSLTLGTAADTTLTVKSIHHGMYPDMMYEGQSDTRGYAYRADPMAPDLEKSLDYTLSVLMERAREKPFEYLEWYLVGKIRTVLSWDIIAGAEATFVYHVENSPYFRLPRFYMSRYYMEKIHGVLMLLALVGTAIVWLPRRKQRGAGEHVVFLRALSLLVIYFLLMHVVGAPYPRYSIPMRPVLYGMALYPLLLAVRVVGSYLGPRIRGLRVQGA